MKVGVYRTVRPKLPTNPAQGSLVSIHLRILVRSSVKKPSSTGNNLIHQLSRMLSFHLLLVVFAMVCRGAIACRAGAMRACPGDSHVGVVYIPSQSKCSFGFAACCPPNVFKGKHGPSRPFRGTKAARKNKAGRLASTAWLCLSTSCGLSTDGSKLQGFRFDNHQPLAKKLGNEFHRLQFFPLVSILLPLYYGTRNKKRMVRSLLLDPHEVQVLCRAALNHVFCKVKSLRTATSAMETGSLFTSPQSCAIRLAATLRQLGAHYRDNAAGIKYGRPDGLLRSTQWIEKLAM
ncbi:hypothetical protein PSHT_12933 [Puccinia striiformis]|uniref:Uncharacterized protein n=1 Tax=Puccinia striiformis TaxID=27350 RepID=A0A2S4UTU7_9BASI|nr:hypothetical protein PSHT_12933 [Puccinia striiformis]